MTEEKKNVGGRPLKFETPDILQEKIDGFFEAVKKGEEMAIVESLALWLKTNCQTLINYEGRPDFKDIIEYAKLRCQENFMKKGINGDVAPAIVVWVSKNCYHETYRDKTEIVSDNTHKGEMSIIDNRAAAKTQADEMLHAAKQRVLDSTT